MQALSGPPSSRASTVVIAVAIVLALIGVGGIAAGAADKPDDDRVASTGTTTTTGADETTTTVAGAAGATTTVAGGSTGTTARSTGTTIPTATTITAACPNPPKASSDPGAHQAPAVGTYTYANCADPSETSDLAIADASSDGVTRRRISEAGQEGEQMGSLTVAFTGNGVLLERIDFGPTTCDLKPDVLLYPASMKVGTEWSGKGSCQVQGFPVNFDGTAKVVDRVAVNVGGAPANAWVVEATIKITFGTETITQRSRDYYDSGRGLDLQRHTELSSSEGTTTRDDKLQSLTPKP